MSEISNFSGDLFAIKQIFLIPILFRNKIYFGIILGFAVRKLSSTSFLLAIDKQPIRTQYPIYKVF